MHTLNLIYKCYNTTGKEALALIHAMQIMHTHANMSGLE